MRIIKPRSTTVPSDRIIRRFEAGLKSGRRPSIEDALDSAARAEWSDLLRTLLFLEVDARRSRGEKPLAHEYLPRFPAHVSIVYSVFPEAAAALASQDTVLDLPIVPVPVPLTRPVTGPLPEAVVLESPVVRPTRPDGRAPSRTVWIIGAAVVLFAATLAVIVFRVAPRKSDDRRSAPVATSLPAVAHPARTAPKPPSGDPERDLAEWVAALGGRGTLLLANGGRRTFGEEIPLPKGKFFVTGLSLPPEAASLWSEADLQQLRGRTRLTSIRLHHPTAITDASLEPLVGLPLTTLELHGTLQVTGAALANFPDLESLVLLSAPAFSDADMAAVTKLAKLRSLAIDSFHVSPQALAGLKNPELRSLLFGEHVRLSPEHIRVLRWLPLEEFESHAGMTDEALLEFAIFPHIKRFRFRQTSLTDAGLKAVLGHGQLEEFRAIGSAITGPGLEYFEERTELRVLDLSRGKIQDAGLVHLPTLPMLHELRLAGCPITDQGAPTLTQIDGLQTLDLSDTEITDVSLKLLRKHPTLRELILINTKATVDWVRDFERATPNCRVVWSPRK